MYKKLLISLFCLIFSQAAYSATMMEEISSIQKQWALTKYRTDDSLKSDEYEKLMAQADALIQRYPDKAEPLIWSAIVYSSYAGAVGGIKSVTKALPAVKNSRDLLLKAEQIDINALGGSVMTSLGALYYQVPGWPLGFGDKKKAREYLEKAVKISQNGLDANYFYGDFLVDRKEYTKAVAVLERALAAPTLDQRPVADRGRRDEIEALLEVARSKS
jgi:tetratricopeptide (TPR) repeat protein